jgi:hypothetical protein
METNPATKPAKLLSPNRRAFPHLSTIRSEGPDGRMRTYCYHRLSRVRIHAEPGTPEFAEEYRLAAQGHKTKGGRRAIRGRRKSPPKPTNIYFVRAGLSGLIKIGKAVDVARRLKTLRTGSSEPLELLGSTPDTSGGLLERAIHRDFAADRARGEWFNPTPALLAYIASCQPPSRDVAAQPPMEAPCSSSTT